MRASRLAGADHCVGQVTDVCGVVRHAGRSRSIPAGHLGRRMIEHDRNPAARQAVYPVGEEHDPDPPARQQGAGRDLTCQPYPGAAAHVLLSGGSATQQKNCEVAPHMPCG